MLLFFNGTKCLEKFKKWKLGTWCFFASVRCISVAFQYFFEVFLSRALASQKSWPEKRSLKMASRNILLRNPTFSFLECTNELQIDKIWKILQSCPIFEQCSEVSVPMQTHYRKQIFDGYSEWFCTVDSPKESASNKLKTKTVCHLLYSSIPMEICLRRIKVSCFREPWCSC